MNISDKINEFIKIEGGGNVRDALNVSLARLEQQKFIIECRDLEIKALLDKIEQLEADIEMIGAGF